MQVTKENMNDLNAIIHIEFNKEDYKPQVEKTLKDYSKKVSMPGFRAGKVPASLVRKMYGQSVFVDELNKLTSETLYNYLKENEIDVLGNPLPLPVNDFNVDVDNAEPIKLSFEIGISPQFKLQLNKDTQFTILEVEPQEEEIEKTIADYQKRLGSTIESNLINPDSIVTFILNIPSQSEGNFEEGKIITVDFQLLSDKTQKIIQGFGVNDSFSTPASDLFANQADLVKHIGDIDADFVLSLVLSKIEEIELAEINQQFFDTIFGEGNVTSLEEMKNRISEDTSKHYMKDGEERFYNEVVNFLIQNIQFELPDRFLQKWLLSVNTDKVSPEDIENNYNQYEKGIRWQLIENKLLEQNNIAFTPEDAIESLQKDFLAYFGGKFDDENLAQRAREIAVNMLKEEKERERVYDNLQKKAIIDLFKNSFTLIQEKLPFEKWVEAMNKPFA
jgi:trigger factor